MLGTQLTPSSSSPSTSLLLVADCSNTRVCVWQGDGTQHITNFMIDGFPRGLCVDMNGYIHVSSVYSHTIQVFDPRKNYTLVQTLGSFGSTPGQFINPTGLCVDEFNTLMVVDHWNHRVQFFRGRLSQPSHDM